MYVKTWIDKMLKAHPEHDFYEKVLDHILKHRLPTGSTGMSASDEYQCRFVGLGPRIGALHVSCVV